MLILQMALLASGLNTPLVHVADTEVLTAMIVAKGITCPRVQLADGQTISLMGVTALSPVGGRVTLEGQWVKRSTCQQGRTFKVTKMTALQK